MSATDEAFGQTTSVYTLPLNNGNQNPPSDVMSKEVLKHSVATSTKQSQDLVSSPIVGPSSAEKPTFGSNSVS